MNQSDFKIWFADYRGRYPAINDYMAKHDGNKLMDTYYETLCPFTLEDVTAVTRGMMAGEIEPVPNVALGTFGEEIRQRVRRIVDERHIRQKNADLTYKWKRTPGVGLPEGWREEIERIAKLGTGGESDG
jgi:hypothetical protein